MATGERTDTDSTSVAARSRRLRLNGWQRLWVVLVVLWTVLVGAFAWSLWPEAQVYRNGKTGEPLSLLYLDPNTGRPIPGADDYPLEPVWHEHAVALTKPLSKVDRILLGYGVTPATSDLPLRLDKEGHPVGAVVNIPNVGSIVFPETMTHDRINAECEEIKAYFEPPQQKRIAELRARRVHWAQFTAAFWLLPPMVLYALGWSTGWIYRGFALKGRDGRA